MMNSRKYANMILMVLFLALASVNALADSPDYDIVDVQVNDISLGSSKTLNIERTDVITVEVELVSRSVDVVPDVRVRAEINGYEFGDIVSKTDIFDLQPNNVTYKKTLELDIPEDLQASRQYTLRIQVSDSRNQEIQEIKLNINEQRHYLRIFDVLLRPTGSIEVGKPIFATVRVENLGEKKERDIEVRVSVPEFGIIARDYIDELVTEVEERITVRDDEESSASSNELMLRIPDDVKTGVYDLLVEVIYNRGHSKVTQRVPLSVAGKTVTETTTKPSAETTIVSIDSVSKTMNTGGEIPFKIMFANMDNIPRIYTLEVSGTQLFADARVDPGFITVQPGRTGEAYVFLKVKPNVETKKQFFTIRALSGTDTIREFSLTADVKGSEAPVSWVWLRNVLYVVFGILIVVLVILLVAWGVRRTSERDEETVETNEGKPLEPSPSVAEGQSYYYYPKH